MILDKIKVSVRGKEIHNLFLKALLIPAIFIGATISLPVTIPLDLILRKMNRNGFLIEEDGERKWWVELKGFKKRQ